LTDSPIEPAAREALLRYEKSLDCVHCGLCLSACPTYEVTGNEADSPRGRIHLMRALAEDRIEADANFREKMELCLVCRACESTCPSGVQYGHMMEITRHELRRQKTSRVASWLLRELVPHPRRLNLVAGLIDLARLTGILRAADFLAKKNWLPQGLNTLVRNRPPLASRADRLPLPRLVEPPEGDARGTLAFFEGCVMRPLFGDVNRAALRTLVEAGYRVITPESQTCCGALQAHAGDVEAARDLARRNLQAFEAAVDAGASHIVLDSAGCGAAMRDWPHWLSGDEARRAQALASRSIDLGVFFHQQGYRPRAKLSLRGRRITWDSPCHLEHAQGHREEGPALLQELAEAEYVPLPGCSDCCGGAGVYNLSKPEMSDRILARKLDQLEATGADLLVTSNPGCILQWRRGIAQRGLAVEVRHLAELM
jgi:glycolate dehydrogenase iron-sulfur subunit